MYMYFGNNNNDTLPYCTEIFIQFEGLITQIAFMSLKWMVK